MQLLLTNDDGIDAPGLAALRQALSDVAPLLIVAPQAHQSGCGHQVTTHQPLVVDQRDDHHYAVAGTPADCIRFALNQLCPTPAWVIAGVNYGGNLGVDIYTSGTVAAVREAAFYRLPGIAFSQYRKAGRPVDWSRAAHWVTRVFNHIQPLCLDPGHFWNVNFPHWQPNDPEPEIHLCPPCTQPLPATYISTAAGYQYQGEYSQRRRDPNSDVAICLSGHIALSRLSILGSIPD